MKLAIVKYNAGNVQSVEFALNRLGINPIVTDDVRELQTADKVIFPGVGEASSAMDYLRKRGLDKVIKNLRQPVLGICLGMQLMCRHSEENNTDCLGIVDLNVSKFPHSTKCRIWVGTQSVAPTIRSSAACPTSRSSISSTVITPRLVRPQSARRSTLSPSRLACAAATSSAFSSTPKRAALLVSKFCKTL